MIKQMLIGLFLVGFVASVMAHDGDHQEGWVDVGGNVRFGEIPVCALVLINGVTQFSCDGTGRYDMEVPVDDNGMITVMVFADGFAPFNQIVTPEQAVVFPIDILLDQNSPTFEVVPTYEPAATEGRFVVSGTVNFGAIPVCALVLANGTAMFSCNENQGIFSLDVPLDQDGNITLMVFAAGFKPYKLITQVVGDSDGDGIPDHLDYDDDNDGVFDVDDVCPLNSNPNCAIDSLIVNSKEWAQPDLFKGVSWDEIIAVCPDGVCTGVLTVRYGCLGIPYPECDLPASTFNLTGWTWAGDADMVELATYYRDGSPEFDCPAYDEFLADGLREWAPDDRYSPAVYGYTRDGDDRANSGYILHASFGGGPSCRANVGSYNSAWQGIAGAWFFR